MTGKRLSDVNAWKWGLVDQASVLLQELDNKAF